MITFDTQEDFEQAVLDAIQNKLELNVTLFEQNYANSQLVTGVEVALDLKGGDFFMTDDDHI